MSIDRITFGKKAEAEVARYLIDHGYVVRAQNYTTRVGEIDLIAQKKDLIAFVEVKIRASMHFNLSEVITHSKQKKIISTALRYIHMHQLFHMVYRFDVALLEARLDHYTITYIENAFTKNEYS